MPDSFDYLLEPIRIPPKFGMRSIDEFDISERLWNVLGRLQVARLDDLSKYTYADVICTWNCGKKTLLELRDLILSLDDGNDLIFETSADPSHEYLFFPKHLGDLPIKLLCKAQRFQAFLSAQGVKTLGALQKADKKVRDIAETKFPGELESLIRRANAGEFEVYVASRPSAEIQALIVRHLHGKIRVPDSMQGVYVQHVRTSARLANILESAGVKTFGELQEFTYGELKQVANCGVKSIFELWQCLIEIPAPLGEDRRISFEPSARYGSELSLSGLLDVINTYVLGITDRDRRIVLDRFGGVPGQQTRTLEEIGQDFGVTRERIRQIENKHLRRLRGLVANRVKRLFATLLSDCETQICPLTSDLLIANVGDNYSLFQFPPAFYLRLLVELGPELPVLAPERTVPESRLKRVQSLIRQIETALQDSVSYRTLEEVWDQIIDRRMVQHFGMGVFFDAIQSERFQTITGDLPSILLIGLKEFKLTCSQISMAILSKSDLPLTPEEIIEKASEKYGRGINLPSPNTLANLPGYDPRFYLLDRRRIGLRTHFRLAKERWNGARNDCYQTMKSVGRPMSTNEILSKSDFDWTRDSTPNELAALLREDVRFTDLGRLLFSLSEWNTSKRETIHDLISKILRESTEPLRAGEIIERIRLYRSFSATSLPAMLRGHSDIEDLGFGYYGLKSQGPYTSFLSTNPDFLKRVVRRHGPITLRDLCHVLEGDVAPQVLLASLSEIPEIRLTSRSNLGETVASYRRISPSSKNY